MVIYSEKKEDVKYDGEFIRDGSRQCVFVELRRYEKDYVLESEVYVDGECIFESRRAFNGYAGQNKMLRKAIAEFDGLLATHPYFSMAQVKAEAPDDDIGEITEKNANAGMIGAL